MGRGSGYGGIGVSSPGEGAGVSPLPGLAGALHAHAQATAQLAAAVDRLIEPIDRLIALIRAEQAPKATDI